ncbi:MAG: hypothetical protein ACI9MR_003119 [Myxococcota bacterium]|jgi:hypothetical protein
MINVGPVDGSVGRSLGMTGAQICSAATARAIRRHNVSSLAQLTDLTLDTAAGSEGELHIGREISEVSFNVAARRCNGAS